MSQPAEVGSRAVAAPPALVAKGLAAFRIFMGVIFGANGLAKVLDKGAYDLKVVSFGLIDRGTARGLLAGYAGPKSHAIAPLKWFYTHLVLAHWPPWSILLTAAEVTIGVLLCLGIASRLGALIGLGLILPLQVMVINNGGYLFEFPPDWVPLVILLVVPSGRAWGFDGRLAARFGNHWPF